MTSGVSMAGILSEYMAKYSGVSSKNNAPTSVVSSKRQRRAEIAKIIRRLENILDSEENYMNRIPENLHSSVVYEAAEQWASVLEEVIDLLESLT